MKNLARLAAVAALMTVSAAHADTFSYAYTFTGPDKLNGNPIDAIAFSFDGTLNGTNITGLSNGSVSLNGKNFYQGVAVTAAGGGGAATATVSGVGDNLSIGGFYLAPGSISFLFGGTGGGYNSDSTYTLINTSVPAAGAVPEPANAALLLAGLAAMGFAVRRRAHLTSQE